MDYTQQVDDPNDTNGNGLGAYRAHSFLSRYDLIGIDSRQRVIFFDGSDTQTALLDSNQSITMLEEHELWADSVAEHVVRFAGEFGPWEWVQPELVEKIERGNMPDVDIPDGEEVIFTTHAREQWCDRGIDELTIEEAWAESIEISWPLDDDLLARYHPDSTCTFLVSSPSVVTTYPPLRRVNPRLRQALYDELPSTDQ